jgi:hypothetical protein
MQARNVWILAAIAIVACSSSDELGRSTEALITPQDGGEGSSPLLDGGNNLTPTTAYTGGTFVHVIPGSFAYVIGGGDASPWVVGSPSKNIFHYSNDFTGPRTWTQEPNSANTSSLAVSPEGTVWKIDTNGLISARTGAGTWAQKGKLGRSVSEPITLRGR